MEEFIVQGSLGLTRGSLLRIEDGRDMLVYVWEGEIWLTEERERRDRVLRAGEWHRLERQGTAIGYALRAQRADAHRARARVLRRADRAGEGGHAGAGGAVQRDQGAHALDRRCRGAAAPAVGGDVRAALAADHGGAVSAPRDARGCEVSGASPRALEHYERALGGFLAWTGEPRAEAQARARGGPGVRDGARARGGAAPLQPRSGGHGRAPCSALRRAQRLPQNARERMHLAAVATALRGDYARARALLALHPRAPSARPAGARRGAHDRSLSRRHARPA